MGKVAFAREGKVGSLRRRLASKQAWIVLTTRMGEKNTEIVVLILIMILIHIVVFDISDICTYVCICAYVYEHGMDTNLILILLS